MERVNGMPIRFVAIKKFSHTREDGRTFEFLPGEVYENDLSSFDYISKKYPGCVQEIEMTQEDWIDLATSRALECKKRIDELERLYGEHLSSYYYGVIPSYEGAKVDGSGYSGGLPDAYNKTHLLQEDIERFERQCVDNFSKNSGGMHM